MLEPLLEFIRKEIPVTSESREEVETHEDPPVSNLVTVIMETQEGKLQVYLNPIEQSINLGSANISLVQKLGKRFDEEMATGKYQEFFGNYE